MTRVKKDIASEEAEAEAEAEAETVEEVVVERETKRETEKVPLVAGATVQGEVEFESPEEAAERREFESLMQYADELHREREQRE